MTAEPVPSAAIVLQPGDQVLVAMAQSNLTREQADLMRTQLAGRFPDVEFTFLAGVAALAVQHATQNPPGDVQSPR